MILVSSLMAAVGSIGAIALADKAEEDKGNGLVNTLVTQFGECGSLVQVLIIIINNFKTYKAQISK